MIRLALPGHTSHEGILLQMEEDVEQYVRTCLVCQHFGVSKTGRTH